MACGSGCCGGPPPGPPAGQSVPIPVTPLTSQDQPDGPATALKAGDEDCCGETAEPGDSCKNPALDHRSDTVKDDCCGAANDKARADKELLTSVDKGCSSGCCSPPSSAPIITDESCNKELATPVDKGCSSGCCSPPSATPPSAPTTINEESQNQEPVDSVGKGCSSGCCSPPSAPPVNNEDKRPSCCEGKSSPCCDTSCIDRLALRECQGGTYAISEGRLPGGSKANDCCRGQDGKACQHHARSAREFYQAKLEALGCICRALLALGEESCCATKGKTSLKKRNSRTSTRSRKSFESSQSTSSCGKNCCPPKTQKGGCCSVPIKPEKSPSVKGCCTGNAPSLPLQDSCCSGPNETGTSCASKPTAKDGCCSGTAVTDGCCGTSKSEKDSCCADNKMGITTAAHEITAPRRIQVADTEKGISGTEHVILSISGMTCTGCETKLQRTLAAVESVTNLKTSLVLSRAEFNLDTRMASIADIKKHLERTTEFTCEKVSNQGASLDFLYPSGVANTANMPWPKGVSDIVALDKRTFRVEFDPKLIGARDLAEKGWDNPMKLAPPRADPTLDAGNKHVRNVGLMTLLSAALTIPVLVMAWAPLPDREMAYASASLALATVVQFVVAGPFYPKALKALIFSKVIEMDLLIVMSTSAAYIFSVVAFGYLAIGQPLSTGEFFETSTLLVTLIMVGRYVAALARQKAVESISIRSLQTPSATIVDAEGKDRDIDARLLQYGDVFKAAPDSRIPTDGTVLTGSSELDESMLTGESKPVEKYVGSTVIAGSINGSGTMTVRVTRLPGENTISAIAGMVDEAKLSKPKIQDIADRVAAYFVPVVVALASITFIIWVAVGITVRHQSGSEAAIQAITYAITVLIVSCPCAIGLAVPMVIVIASGVAAERGVIFKSAESIEVAYKTSHVVFDKTGTLTQGKLSVSREEYIQNDEESKSLLLGLISSIKHPVSVAVAAHLLAAGVSATSICDAKVLTGKGVEGSLAGSKLRAGNSRWLGVSSNSAVEPVLAAGYTAFCFMIDDTLVAVFGLEDSLRPDALSTVQKLQENKVTVHLISGDDHGAVRSIASQLSIPDDNVRSRCTPGDKQAYIQQLLTVSNTPETSKKAKQPVVMFCGDGTNDAVALAQATIGVHMNEGTDVAKSAADVVLMRPALSGIVTAMTVSRKSIHRIAFNFGWSFVYNTVAVLLASGAFVRARIPPEFAGLGELVSVLPVIAAAVMLRWAKV